ncbi:hypothetical protein GCM10011363_29810 [Marivita lacus]|uniref:HipA-like C-terminal domain-containing protein n=1 Tax=Marivita lacus TaxID=1323742 RepID=A0ABQ1KUA0_9RHOB|nr:hypothetical protein GCM10011363_29810 [Marivita lacus]
MARAAGIAMPWAMVLRSRRGDTFFAVERFDRRGAERVHMHTAAHLLDLDFRQPSIDNENLLKLVRWTTRHAEDQDEMFRRMTFNVLTHNRDDHLKNHSFLMDAEGSWSLSPAYDVSFSDGPGGEHHLAIAGEGRRRSIRSPHMHLPNALFYPAAFAENAFGPARPVSPMP